MVGNRSRTYRLHLSSEGTDLFLACHYRLARIARSFIPYGATLSVALLLMGSVDTDELVAELTMPSLKKLVGNEEHYVGASAQLKPFAGAILERVAASDHIDARPTVAKLHVAAIAIMAASEDRALARAFQRLSGAFNKADRAP